MHFRMAPYQLALNGWRVLSSLFVLNCSLNIDLGLGELAYLYEFHADG